MTMNFFQAGDPMRFITIAGMMFLYALLMALLVLECSVSEKKRPTIVTLFLFLLDGISVSLIVVLWRNDLLGEYAICRVPLWFWGLLCLCGIPYVIYCFFYYRTYVRNHITTYSLKQGIDQLPAGICEYTPDGIIILKNRTMDELSYRMTSHAVLNGNQLWNNFNGQDIRTDCRRLCLQGADLMMISDDTIWSCRRKELDNKNIQLFAYNVTEEYYLSMEQQENNQRIVGLNEKLREYGRHVDEAVRQEEYLATKIRIHDSLGRVLLSAMNVLTNKTGDAQKLISDWEQSLQLLLGEASEEVREEDPLAELKKAAEHLGVRLKITGAIPKQDKALRLLLAGARECLTNALRHGNADELDIRITQKEQTIRIEYSNNGEVPQEEISEGGGLTSLRHLVERENAEMEVASRPQFCLTIVVYEYLN